MGLFSAFGTDLTLAVQPPEDWHKVLDKISTGKMPPRTSASLATGNRGRYQFNRAAVEAFRINREAGPGRVTARRLNKVEYNNPIRDLLGVHLRPADEFPVDDSGYGFDNIGDVLSISPLLMEKYTAAAKKFRALPSVAKPFPSW